jgi:hypothetical protein
MSLQPFYRPLLLNSLILLSSCVLVLVMFPNFISKAFASSFFIFLLFSFAFFLGSFYFLLGSFSLALLPFHSGALGLLRLRSAQAARSPSTVLRPKVIVMP